MYALPTPSDYVSLSVEVAAEGAEVGEPAWPAGKPFKLEGLDEELWVYEGNVRVDVPFEFIIQRGEPMGDRTVTLTVRHQACDAGTCCLPEEASFQLVVKERPSVE